jgi:hypothetical protein
MRHLQRQHGVQWIADNSKRISLNAANHESATADKFPRMDTNEAAEGEPRPPSDGFAVAKMALMTRMFGITKQARFGNRELA